MSNRPAMKRAFQMGTFFWGASPLPLWLAALRRAAAAAAERERRDGGGARTTGSGGHDRRAPARAAATPARAAARPARAAAPRARAARRRAACKNQLIQVTADITTDTTWACNTYVLTQKIHIDGGATVATLTIAPGSKIYGAGSPSSPAALISTRNGRLVAVGTPTAPITFTSFAPGGSRAPGDTFAGVVMLGEAS